MWAYNLMVSNIIRSKQHILVGNNNNKKTPKQNKNEKKEILFPNYFLVIYLDLLSKVCF